MSVACWARHSADKIDLGLEHVHCVHEKLRRALIRRLDAERVAHLLVLDLENFNAHCDLFYNLFVFLLLNPNV